MIDQFNLIIMVRFRDKRVSLIMTVVKFFAGKIMIKALLLHIYLVM